MFELRFDLLSTVPGPGELDLIRADILPRLYGRRWIATIRRDDDLGAWPCGDETGRRRLLTAVLTALKPDYVDLETGFAGGVVLEAARGNGASIVRSLHDATGVPEDLDGVLHRLADECEPGDVAKLAVTPQSATDVVRLVRAARGLPEGEPRRVILGMGEYGLLTRAAPWILRSEWSYSSAADGAGAAPGHFGPEELRNLFRVGTAGPGWRLFAVLGAPVAHSRSPAYHNARLAADGIEAVYLPVRADAFDEFEALARELPIHGASVTVPHKEAALAAARERADTAVRVGAANTLIRTGMDRGWRAYNTDVDGFLSALPERPLHRALVVGAGGAARAVVAALTGRKIDVTICNRTAARAARLAAEFGLSESSVLPRKGPFNDVKPDIVVQTTSVGMEPRVDADPVPAYRFSGNEVVYDIIYTPEETRFLRRAARAGCTVIPGTRMFAAQAALQYRLFTGSL